MTKETDLALIRLPRVVTMKEKKKWALIFVTACQKNVSNPQIIRAIPHKLAALCRNTCGVDAHGGDEKKDPQSADVSHQPWADEAEPSSVPEAAYL